MFQDYCEEGSNFALNGGMFIETVLYYSPAFDP